MSLLELKRQCVEILSLVKEIGVKAEVSKEHPVEKSACGMEILSLVKEIGLKAEVSKEHIVEKTVCGMEILSLIKK